MRKVATFLIALVIGLGGVVGYRWYSYVTNAGDAKDPYDEVGIGLNSRMPGPLNKWGCEQLQKHFGRMLPPYGCASADGRSWM
jgi:hypothetical protein